MGLVRIRVREVAAERGSTFKLPWAYFSQLLGKAFSTLKSMMQQSISV